MAAYHATKGGLISLTRHLAAVWGQDGVRVNALAPGYFPTELTGFLADPAFAQSVRDRTLLGRVPEPGELDGRSVPCHRRFQLHARASPRHRPRMDRGMPRHP